jgi:hypothetical protein
MDSLRVTPPRSLPPTVLFYLTKALCGLRSPSVLSLTPPAVCPKRTRFDIKLPLTGVNIPGTNPVIQYPGATNTPVQPNATLNLTWQTPAENVPGSVSYSVRVTSSDQPITVGSDFQWSGFKPLPCSLLPK